MTTIKKRVPPERKMEVLLLNYTWKYLNWSNKILAQVQLTTF